jgi:hypothetical protein
MTKRELIIENKKLKNEIEDLKRQLTYKNINEQLLEIKLALKKDEVRYFD